MVPNLQNSWVPAFAGTTERSNFTYHFKVVGLPGCIVNGAVVPVQAGIATPAQRGSRRRGNGEMGLSETSTFNLTAPPKTQTETQPAAQEFAPK